MKFSVSSSKPVKVRKKLANSSTRDKALKLSRAMLSTDLKAKYASNSVRVRPGDSVKLVRGEYAGVEGKIQKVFPQEGRITVEGVTREKIAGGTTPLRIHTSNVVVTGLNLDDKFRREKLEGSS
ncbi:MAG TPA: 50S ribosomal protein L24 [Nitrososphaerales archaeon]|nr:50S ribosomal protein L24 [Nitrososphaerales archaeon]